MSHPTRGGFFLLHKRLPNSTTRITDQTQPLRLNKKRIYEEEARINRFGQAIAVANHLQISRQGHRRAETWLLRSPATHSPFTSCFVGQMGCSSFF
jgi:hypothetical protein